MTAEHQHVVVAEHGRARPRARSAARQVAISTRPRLGVPEPLGHPAGAADDDGGQVGGPVPLDPGGPRPDHDRIGELAQ